MTLPLIAVNVLDYIRDCPPWDQTIDEDLLPEIAKKIADRFDSTVLYNQIDELGCQILREYGLAPEQQSTPESP